MDRAWKWGASSGRMQWGDKTLIPMPRLIIAFACVVPRTNRMFSSLSDTPTWARDSSTTNARHGSWLANNQWVGHKFVQPHILSVFPWMILCHDDLEAVFTKWADRYFWVVRGGFYPTYIEFPLNHLVQYIVGLAILTTRFVYRSRSMAGRA